MGIDGTSLPPPTGGAGWRRRWRAEWQARWRPRLAALSTRTRWLGWLAATGLLALIGLPPFYAAATAALPWLLMPGNRA